MAKIRRKPQKFVGKSKSDGQTQISRKNGRRKLKSTDFFCPSEFPWKICDGNIGRKIHQKFYFMKKCLFHLFLFSLFNIDI